MDAKARWSARGDNNELVWEARRRFQQSKRRTSGAAITSGGAWKGAVEDADSATMCLLEGQLVKQPRGRSNSLLKGAARARTRYFKLYRDSLRYYAQEVRRNSLVSYYPNLPLSAVYLPPRFTTYFAPCMMMNKIRVPDSGEAKTGSRKNVFTTPWANKTRSARTAVGS